MAEVRETQVTQDMDGNVVDRKTVIERPRKKGGFGWGFIIGALIIVGAIGLFAYNQGSFQTAGREADQATRTAQVETAQTADNARQAVNNATESDSSQQSQPTQSN